jgi:hypothetical protein
MSRVYKHRDPIVGLVERICLCYFIAMVWKTQINAPRMKIKLLPQHCIGHGRTFNVPSWSAPAPWRIPRYDGRGGRGLLCCVNFFPQRKISLVPFHAGCFFVATVRCTTVWGTQLFAVTIPQGSHIEINAIVQFICVAMFSNGFNVLDDVRHVFRHTRNRIWSVTIQCFQIFKKFTFVFLGE